MAHMPMRSTGKRNNRVRKRSLPSRKVRPAYFVSHSSAERCLSAVPKATPVPVPRQHDSDSDSEYGARSKKKKKLRISDDSIRVSSRGGKIPNYYDDVDELAQFEDDGGEGYYAPGANGHQYEEEHEIEGVYYHTRDEGRETDPEDFWHDNVVRDAPTHFVTNLNTCYPTASDITSSGEVSRIFTIRTKIMNS